MNIPEKVRIDKWLWAVRLYKTRSLATDACRSGHIKIGGLPVKPSHEVKVNELITAWMEPMTKTIKVLGLLDRRVSAAAARDFAEDQTDPAEYQKAREERLHPAFYRPKGTGRPTKKERRALLGIKAFE